jgi:hypothetical protein
LDLLLLDRGEQRRQVDGRWVEGNLTFENRRGRRSADRVSHRRERACVRTPSAVLEYRYCTVLFGADTRYTFLFSHFNLANIKHQALSTGVVKKYCIRAGCRCCATRGVLPAITVQKAPAFVTTKHNDLSIGDSTPSNDMKMHMTLSDAQTELERQGYTVTTESDGSIVGMRSDWRWSVMSRIDVTVFLKELPVLTMDQIALDLQALPDRLDDHSIGGCPPEACGGSLVVLVYLASSIEPGAADKILGTPGAQWSHVTFLAAQDGEGVSHYVESTPVWGRAFYEELRYVAGRLTGRPLPERVPECSSRLFVSFVIFCYAPLVVLFLDRRSMLTAMLTGLSVSIVTTAVKATKQWCRRRSRRRRDLNRPRPLTESGFANIHATGVKDMRYELLEENKTG